MAAAMRSDTHYDVLEVVEHASVEVIRGAYKHLQQKWHPDRNVSPRAAEMTRRINSAYAVLSDAALRGQYDRSLRASRDEARPARTKGFMTRRDWIAGGAFFFSLATFTTNGLTSPVATPPPPEARIEIASLEQAASDELRRSGDDLLSRMILNAERAAALEQMPVSAPATAQAVPAAEDERETVNASREWWHDAALLAESGFKLRYVGPIGSKPGIGLLFTATPDLASLKRNVVVLTEDGRPAQGRWTLGENPRVAHFGSFGPGHYTVELKSGLADASGRTLGLALQGPIDIEEIERAGNHGPSSMKVAAR